VALLVLPLGWLVVGGKTKCATCAFAKKLFSKNESGQKIKNTEGLAVCSERCLSDMFLSCPSLLIARQFDVSTVANTVAPNVSSSKNSHSNK
jgi:hypothetical protein